MIRLKAVKSKAGYGEFQGGSFTLLVIYTDMENANRCSYAKNDLWYYFEQIAVSRDGLCANVLSHPRWRKVWPIAYFNAWRQGTQMANFCNSYKSKTGEQHNRNPLAMGLFIACGMFLSLAEVVLHIVNMKDPDIGKGCSYFCSPLNSNRCHKVSNLQTNWGFFLLWLNVAKRNVNFFGS